MSNDQIPLYLGIPLAVFLVAAAFMLIMILIAVWKDLRD